MDCRQAYRTWPADRSSDRLLERSVDRQPERRRARLTLRDSESPASAARHFSRHTLGSWGWSNGPEEPGGVGDILLVVSELVTNADRHGGGAEWVALTATDCETIRVEVADRSRRLPAVRRTVVPALPGGHGLRLILRTADHIGVHLWRHRPGKAVWAEFHRIAPRPGRACSSATAV